MAIQAICRNLTQHLTMQKPCLHNVLDYNLSSEQDPKLPHN